MENWFRVHTSIIDSRKFEGISLAARGLWVSIGALVKERGDSQGRLVRRDGSPLEPARLAREIGYAEEDVSACLRELLEAGLIERDTDGYLRMHDWQEWQVREDERERWREQQRRHRNGMQKSEPVETPAENAECHAMSRDVTPCHGASRDVTPCHGASRDVTRCHLESKSKSKSKNMYSFADAGALASEQISQPVLAEEKPKKQPTLRLQIEHPPPKKPPKPDYFQEVKQAFLAVLGSEHPPDALAIRACLAAWKQVREAGTSAEEITSLWRDARARASPEYRERITLLWTLNNGEKARRLAAYDPAQARKEPMPSYHRPFEVPADWGAEPRARSEPACASEPVMVSVPTPASEPDRLSKPLDMSEPAAESEPRNASEPLPPITPESESEPIGTSEPALRSEPEPVSNPAPMSEIQPVRSVLVGMGWLYPHPARGP